MTKFLNLRKLTNFDDVYIILLDCKVSLLMNMLQPQAWHKAILTSYYAVMSA